MQSEIQLPPLPKPPHDPTSFLLNSRVGWSEANGLAPELEITAGGTLALASLPGTRRTLVEPHGSFGGLTPPGNVALGPEGDIYLLDCVSHTLKRFDPCECRFDTVPMLGGCGTDARQFFDPAGITIYRGNVYVCDTGNHRVSIFSLKGFALRAVWRLPDSFKVTQMSLEKLEGAGVPHEMVNRLQGQAEQRFIGRRNYLEKIVKPLIGAANTAKYGKLVAECTACPWMPWDVAFDRQGNAYVTDIMHGYVHRFAPTGTWESNFPMARATWIASDCKDRLYIIVHDEEKDKDGKWTATVRVVDVEGHDVEVLDAQGRPIDINVRLDVLARYFPCLPFSVDAQGRLDLRGLCNKAGHSARGATTGNTGIFELHGNPIPVLPVAIPPRFPERGAFFSKPLDSELYQCQWHRVILQGQIPDGTRVRVSTYTSEAQLSDRQIKDLHNNEWQPMPSATRIGIEKQTQTEAETGNIDDDGLYGWDGLVRSVPGRYLWLRLELFSDGVSTPAIDNVVIEFPRISLRRYLPAVFGMEPVSADFTDRFLSLFDTTLRSIERKIDNLAHYFDPLSTPTTRDPKTGMDFLSWLASWIGLQLDRHWPEERRRRFLKESGKLFNLRGTREGLWRQLLIYLGMEPETICCAEDRPRLRCHPRPLNCAPAERRACAWGPPPLILEHFQLRRWLWLGASRLGDQAVLWGTRIVNRSRLDDGAQVGHTTLLTIQDPHRDPFHHYAHKFSVFVPGCFRHSDRHRKGLERLINTEKPVHSQFQIEYVDPRFRIGFQSMIGFDAVIGRYPEGVVLTQSTLGKATVLGEAPHRRGGPTFEIGSDSRIGSTTRLD